MKGKLNGLDLFSGIGGIGEALQDWVTTRAYCERERSAQRILLSRMFRGEIDNAPIWDDVTTLAGSMLPSIDIIFGGFPCQDISVAGLGKGLAGERSGLFSEIVRLTKETKPPFVFLENVPAIRTRGLRQVVGAFTEMGYDCRWTCISAASVGANHKRERWFLLAYSDSAKLRLKQGWSSGQDWEGKAELGVDGEKEYVAYSTSEVSSGLRSRETAEHSEPGSASKRIFRGDWWAVEPNVGRVANGVQFRNDRIRALGNSVVPLQVKTAFEILSGIRGVK